MHKPLSALGCCARCFERGWLASLVTDVKPALVPLWQPSARLFFQDGLCAQTGDVLLALYRCADVHVLGSRRMNDTAGTTPHTAATHASCSHAHVGPAFCGWLTSVLIHRGEEEMAADLETQKAANRKILLEMIGDRPHADAAAPEEYIFVCKLNAHTTEEDLETIFSRFGEIVACDIIRDKKTGDSLNYAFIGFTEKQAAEEAYLKMNNALIDDRCVLPASACGCLRLSGVAFLCLLMRLACCCVPLSVVVCCGVRPGAWTGNFSAV